MIQFNHFASENQYFHVKKELCFYIMALYINISLIKLIRCGFKQKLIDEIIKKAFENFIPYLSNKID